METIFECSQCHKTITHESNFSTGYGIDKNDNKVCFTCCGENDRKELLALRPKEKMALYFSNNQVTNWPGTLKIPVNYSRKGRHNITGSRIDFWFGLDHQRFHGLQIGNNTEIAHIQKVK